jgi:hypothetical protein
MDSPKSLLPKPTELIDWMHEEGVLELDWDFPEDGNLFEAGLDAAVAASLVEAVEDEYGVVLTAGEITGAALMTPAILARLIAERAP